MRIFTLFFYFQVPCPARRCCWWSRSCGWRTCPRTRTGQPAPQKQTLDNNKSISKTVQGGVVGEGLTPGPKQVNLLDQQHQILDTNIKDKINNNIRHQHQHKKLHQTHNNNKNREELWRKVPNSQPCGPNFGTFISLLVSFISYLTVFIFAFAILIF